MNVIDEDFDHTQQYYKRHRLSQEDILKQAHQTITSLSEKGEVRKLSSQELSKWNYAMKVIDEEYEQTQESTCY